MISAIPADIGLYGERLAVVLGYITLVSGLAAFATCRVCISLVEKAGFHDPLQHKWYRAIFKYHGYYWPVLWITLVLHVMTALMHTQFPQIGDPDAAIHLYILLAGLVSLIALIVLGFSCRTFGGIVNLFTGKTPLQFRLFGKFYMRHGLYWLILLAVFAVHFVFAYRHIGFWPIAA